MTTVYVPEVMTLVKEEVTEEFVEATLAPDCADSLQPVLAVFVKIMCLIFIESLGLKQKLSTLLGPMRNRFYQLLTKCM